MGEHREAVTPMRDHVARFWRCVENEQVRLLVEMRREVGHDSGQPSVYHDSSSFPDEVAKALAAERDRHRSTINALVGALEEARHLLDSPSTGDIDFIIERDARLQVIDAALLASKEGV